MSIQKIREWIEGVKSKPKEWFRRAVACALAGMYVLGVLCTGLDRRYKGFSLWPWNALRSLFSIGGSLILLTAFTAFLIWAVWSIRRAQHGGMKKDDRNFWYSDKGAYGTAEFMDEQRMMQQFDCKPESKVEEAEGDIIGVKNKRVLSRPKNSRHNKNCAVIGSAGSMKSRTAGRCKIIGCKRRGESFLATDPKGGATRSQLKRLGVEPKTSGMKGAAY